MLEVKDAEINKPLPKPQAHSRHKQKTVNETTDGWAIAEEGQGSHPRRNEIRTGFCRTKSRLPLQQEVMGTTDKAKGICQAVER